MKKIIIYTCLILFLFSALPLDVFASDDSSEDGSDWWYEQFAKDGYLVMNDDYILDYLLDNWYYGPIGLILDSSASTPIKLGQARNVFKEHPEMMEQLSDNIKVYVTNNIGYYNVLAFNYDFLTSVYFENSASMDFVKGNMSHFPLSDFGSAKGSNVNYYTLVSNFDLRSTNLLNTSVSEQGMKDAFSAFSSADTSKSAFVQYNFYDEFGKKATFEYLKFPNGTAQNQSNTAYYGRNRGFQFGCLVYTDSSYSFVPCFTSVTSLTNFLGGLSSIYVAETLSNLDFDNLAIDYSLLQNNVRLAIAQSGVVTSIELNSIINDSISSYLESISVNTELLLLVTQRGLINPLTDEPYLKEISLKIDELISKLPSGSSGGVNLDLTKIEGSLDTIIANQVATNQKLDEIKSLLAVNNLPDLPSLPDIDLDTSELLDTIKALASSKFPFSIVNDLQIVVLMFSADPVKPDLTFTVDLPFMEGSTDFTIDLVWYDSFRPYWFAFCELAFLIFLLVLSTKIISALKE